MVTGAGQRLDTGTRLDTLRNELEHTPVTDVHDTSALGEGFDFTPVVVPVRGHLDSIKGLLTRLQTAVSWQEPLLQDVQSITVWPVGCDIKFPRSFVGRQSSLCLFMDMIRYAISMSLPRFRELPRRRIDRRVQEILSRCIVPPDPGILSFMGRVREEPESGGGSNPDEGASPKMSGHCGKGQPMKVGVGYTQRDFCDGQSW